jgi:hypothetical protein
LVLLVALLLLALVVVLALLLEVDTLREVDFGGRLFPPSNGRGEAGRHVSVHHYPVVNLGFVFIVAMGFCERLFGKALFHRSHLREVTSLHRIGAKHFFLESVIELLYGHKLVHKHSDDLPPTRLFLLGGIFVILLAGK